jgi:subtilase family serine protease
MRFHHSPAKASIAALALLALTPLPATALSEHNVPIGLPMARYEGRVDQGKEMNLTVVLKIHNRAEFDKLVEDLYDPASSRYRQWLTDAELEKYAPTAREFETVKDELVRQGFRVVSADPQRFSIRVHGTAATVEKAFQTELDNFSYNGRVFQAHIRDSYLAGPAGDLIDGVAGIDRHLARPKLSYVIDPRTGKPASRKLLSTKEDLATFAASLTDTPLTWTATPTKLTTPGESLPTASCTGYEYVAHGGTAAFTPSQLQAHYGLPITQGSVVFNGKGQTIALVEGYGYANAEVDANAAARQFDLPAFTSANFEVIYPEGKPLNPNAGADTGWNEEIALDVQSAHAIAPGAKIVVVASSGQDDEDQIASLNYIISHKLASTVSNSWENDSEAFAGADQEAAFTTVLELGAGKGISFQFSSGDSGDDGFGTPLGSVEVPANSRWVTAVGGTSVLNNPNSVTNPWITTGWGNDGVYLYAFGVEDPPLGFFHGGAGGGESLVIPRPSWQSKLGGGSGRLVPDVAALADPFTGFPVVVTMGGKQYAEVIGGTSLASPIFTAVWAIADQFAGKALGQAAPAVSRLKSTEIADVVPPSAAVYTDDVAGTITDTEGAHAYNRTTLFTHAENLDGPGDLDMYSQRAFLSALWPGAFGNSQYDVAISFGTDSSLTVTPGWDNVTGWGEPNGLAFIEGVAGTTTGAKTPKE